MLQCNNDNATAEWLKWDACGGYSRRHSWWSSCSDLSRSRRVLLGPSARRTKHFRTDHNHRRLCDQPRPICVRTNIKSTTLGATWVQRRHAGIQSVQPLPAQWIFATDISSIWSPFWLCGGTFKFWLDTHSYHSSQSHFCSISRRTHVNRV